MQYKILFIIFALVIGGTNPYSKNTYLKYSPSEDASCLMEKSIIGIADNSSSIGLSYFNMAKKPKTYKIDKGDRFGYLVFTGNEKRNPIQRRWLGEFICDCGETKFIRIDVVIRGNERSCGCKSRNNSKKNQKKKAMGEDYAFYVLWEMFRKNSKTRNKDFQITIEDLKRCYLEQNGRCYYTGSLLSVPKSFTLILGKDIASIDRIDSTMGYTKDNIRLVTKTINFMKYTLSHEEFLENCKAIVRNFKL